MRLVREGDEMDEDAALFAGALDLSDDDELCLEPRGDPGEVTLVVALA